MLEVTKRPTGAANQYEFVVRAPIAAAADDIYALVDWADERNAKRQLGDEVTATSDDGSRYRLVVRFMPELQFDYEVLEAIRPKAYGFNCVTTPAVGHLEHSRETFRIEPSGDDRCLLTFTMIAQFQAGIDPAQTEVALQMMTVACHNSVAKLKAYAEHGVGTAEAFENVVLMPL